MFYYDACNDENKLAIVWSNLMAHHYKNDLTKFDEDEEKPFDAKTLPRYLLASNQEFFNSLFLLLDFGGFLADKA